MLSPGQTLADIGTDHGYVPIEALRRGLCERAIACDIGTGPLARAAEHAEQYGVSEHVDLRLGDGLEPVSPGEADHIVIAGMGGPLMADILCRGGQTACAARQLILGPQSELDVFRRSLLTEYSIEAERLVEEEGKYYFLIDARPGADPEVRPYTDAELLYGRRESFDAASLQVRERLLARDRGVAENILAGLRENNSEAAAVRREELYKTLQDIDALR